MPKVSRYRSFSREFKLKVIARLEAGERGSDLAHELSIKRSIIYRWRDAFRRGGSLALRPKRGRPKKAEAQERTTQRGVNATANDLADSRRQIAALEAKVGRQQLDLDFFKVRIRRGKADPACAVGWLRPNRPSLGVAQMVTLSVAASVGACQSQSGSPLAARGLEWVAVLQRAPA